MKNNRLSLSSLFLLLLCFLLAPFASAQDSEGLRLKIESEEPSGIFLDNETVHKRRAALFSIHVFNETSEEQRVILTWRWRDSGGKVVQSDQKKYPVAAGDYISQRELFQAPGRGAFRLEVTAFARRKGMADLKTESVFPLAVIAAPASDDTRPFLLLDAPFDLNEKQLDALSRSGARVLRTSVSLTDSNANEVEFWAKCSAALEERQKRGLATVGVLHAPENEGADPTLAGEQWLQWALRTMIELPQIHAWEIVGGATPEAISELARAAQNMNPMRSVLASAHITDNWKQLRPANGLLLPLSTDLANAHSAALHRALVGIERQAEQNGLASLHVRDVGALNTSRRSSALDSAQLLTTQTVTALSAGSQGVSTRLLADDEIGQESLARIAAFAALSSQIGNAQFHSEAFPNSPIIHGAIFGKDQGPGAVAVLWTAPGQDGKDSRGRLDAWFPEAQIFDFFGNLTESVEHKNLSIPLSPLPIFLATNAAPEALARSLSEGSITGIAPLAAQVLPLEQPIEYDGEMIPKDNTFEPSVKTAVRVRLQNVGIGAASGTLKIAPPPGWKLHTTEQQFELAPGASRLYEFDIWEVRPAGAYPFKIGTDSIVQTGGKTVKRSQIWHQEAPVATANNVPLGESREIDGELSDWSNAHWMELASKRVRARLALQWDTHYLYLAARVREPRFDPRDATDKEYAFWKNSDAIQLGFGMREEDWMQPGSKPFRDTDFGFLLSPFHTRVDGTYEGRVLRLWDPQTPFGALSDRTRWGGAVKGARLEIRRDERSGETFYEAAIPLSELPELDPISRAATRQEPGKPIRFSWIVHNNEGEELQWAKERNVFPWWNNTGSFLPAHQLSFAAQTLLGFVRKGEIAAGEPPHVPAAPPAPYTPILPPDPPAPTTPAEPEEPEEPAETEEEYLPPYLPELSDTDGTPSEPAVQPAPFPTAPIPPDLLPPAPPPEWD